MWYIVSALAILLGMVLVVSFFLLPWLAEENILVTTVKEGTVKAIMRGDSFDHFIMSFAGYHLSDQRESCEYDPEGKPCEEWEVRYHHDKEKDSVYDKRPRLLKHLGLYWVGWPWAKSVYVYGFEWNETYTEKSEGKEKVLPRAEATDFIYVKDFTYAIVTDSAETKDRLPTNELTLVTVAIRNPYRALFSGEDWMQRVTAAINRIARSFVGDTEFQELISPKKETAGWAEFSEKIIALNTKLPDDLDEKKKPWGLQGRYGVEIRTADLQTIELSGEIKKQDQEATTKVYVARQEAEAAVLTGTAKAKVVELMGDAEALALSKRLAIIKEHGEAGIALAGYDAIQESSKNPGSQIVWANNPLSVLAGLLKPETKGGEKS